MTVQINTGEILSLCPTTPVMHPLFPVACPRAATIEKTQKQSKGKTSLPAADFSVIFTLSVLKEPVFFRTPGA
jgi:hypothetical protein